MSEKELLDIIEAKLDLKRLLCAVCLYLQDGRKANGALTVIEGYAVCEDHLGYVAQGERFAAILRLAREAEAAAARPEETTK